jgi:hypothetical protein
MEYAKIYRDIQPILSRKLRKRRLLYILLGIVGTLFFLGGGWLFVIIPFVILITDFVFKNNVNQKGISIIKARVLNKKSAIEPSPNNQQSLSDYSFELDVFEANFLSCLGKVNSNKALIGYKSIKVGENLDKRFERDAEVRLVVLSNKKCVAYVLNGEVFAA